METNNSQVVPITGSSPVPVNSQPAVATSSQQADPIGPQPDTPMSTPPLIEKASEKSSKVFTFIAIFLFLISAGGFGYWYYQEKAFKEPEPKPVPSVMPTLMPTVAPISTPKAQVPDGWKTYRNEEHGFKIKYPDKVDKVEIKENDLTSSEFFEKYGRSGSYWIINLYNSKYKDSPYMVIYLGDDNLENLAIDKHVDAIYQQKLKDSQENNFPPPLELKNTKFVKINNLNAYQGRILAFDSYKLRTYLLKNEKVIIVEFDDENPNFNFTEENKELFLKILSTFRFLEKDKTAAIPSPSPNGCKPMTEACLDVMTFDWAYNADKNECVQPHSDCGGDSFSTKEECEQKCLGKN